MCKSCHAESVRLWNFSAVWQPRNSNSKFRITVEQIIATHKPSIVDSFETLIFAIVLSMIQNPHTAIV